MKDYLQQKQPPLRLIEPQYLWCSQSASEVGPSQSIIIIVIEKIQ